VVDVLKRGGIIAYPTDTYYGIGCDIMNKKSIEKIYQLKQRKKIKPFSFICSGLKHISRPLHVCSGGFETGSKNHANQSKNSWYSRAGQSDLSFSGSSFGKSHYHDERYNAGRNNFL
jgi:hypothetical protein